MSIADMKKGETIRGDCPYCRTTAVGLTIEHIRTWKTDRYHYLTRYDVMVICGICNRTLLAKFEASQLLEIIPSPPEPPKDIPEPVERYFRQGVDNLSRNYDAAGIMFRKALETALKIKFPKIGDMSLKNRIDKIAAQGALTSDLAAWANEIRDVGNEAAHGKHPSSKEDAQDLHDFTQLVLLYLYTLPAMLSKAQARRGPKVETI